MKLEENARQWLMHLPANSISFWTELCDKFVGTFTGGYQPPKTINDLRRVVQRDDEPLRKFIQQFNQVHHSIPDAHEAAVIATFHANVKMPRMLQKLSTRPVKTITELFEIADKVARAEEAIMPINLDFGKKTAGKPGSGNHPSSGNGGNRQRGHQTVFATAAAGTSSKQPTQETVAAAVEPTSGLYCKIHKTNKHDLSECRTVQML